ncbi:N-acetylmuramoyl-L-alanine amidase [Corynebacterium lehmanniae]
MQQRRSIQGGAARPARAAIMPVIVSVLLVTALVAANAFSGNRILKVQSLGSGAPEVYTTSSSFAAGDNITVDDAAIRTQGGEEEQVRRVVKEFSNDREFSIVGLTWTGERDIAAYVRSQKADGTWSEWFEMDPVDPQAGSDKFGTEPIYVGRTKRIQVSTGNVDLLEGGRAVSDAPTTAKDIEAVFLDGGTGTAEGGIQPVADSYTQGMPKVVTRAQWGAGRSSAPYYSEPTTAATVHHTAGSNNYSEAEAPGIVRGIWNYHANNLGWGDIGYHALVDKYGNIYEGRAGGMDRGPQGAHVGSFNQNTWGVSMLGDYQQAEPTPAALRAMGEIIGWKAAVAGFDPTGSSYHYAEGNFRGSKYAAGQGAMFNNINAHRDFHYNTCPGDNLYSKLPVIRATAATKYRSLGGGRSGIGSVLDRLNGDDSTTTATSPVAPAPAPTHQGSPSNGTPDGTLAALSSGDPNTIATVAGTAIGLVLLFLAAQDQLPTVSTDGDTQVFEGLTLAQAADLAKQISPAVAPTLNAFGSSEAAQVWTALEPTLGKLVAGVGGPTGPAVALYSSGIGARNNEGEIIALVGKIAEAWLQQGLDAGPLGMPVTQQFNPTADTVRVDFEGGFITYNPSTNAVDINTN